jgi:hypothetical protein
LHRFVGGTVNRRDCHPLRSEERASRRFRSWRSKPLADLRRRLGLTGSFCGRVAAFPRRHRPGLRPGPLGLVCHSFFKRNGVRGLAYCMMSPLAERGSSWRDHVPEWKSRPAGRFLIRVGFNATGGIRHYRHNETISTRSRDAGTTIGGTSPSRNLDRAISGIRASFRKACSSPQLSPTACRRPRTAMD